MPLVWCSLLRLSGRGEQLRLSLLPAGPNEPSDRTQSDQNGREYVESEPKEVVCRVDSEHFHPAASKAVQGDVEGENLAGYELPAAFGVEKCEDDANVPEQFV